MRKFYVYAYYELEQYNKGGLPFYMGKGSGRRISYHLRNCQNKALDVYNTLFYRKLRKMRLQGYKPKVVKIIDNLLEKEALALEVIFIQLIGRRNLKTGSLCNLTNGGDGVSGHIVSVAVRKRMSDAHKGKILTEEWRRNIGLANKGLHRSEKTKRLIGNCRRGKHHSEETKRRLSLYFKGKKHSSETRNRMSKIALRRPVNAFDSDGNCIYQFDSIKNVINKGFTRCCVSNCLANRQTTHKGLIWRYADA